MEHLFHPLFRMLGGIVDELRIFGESDVYFDGFRLAALLRLFPSLKSLAIFSASITFSKVTSFRNINTLELTNVEPYEMELLPRQFPTLRKLRINTYRENMTQSTVPVISLLYKNYSSHTWNLPRLFLGSLTAQSSQVSSWKSL